MHSWPHLFYSWAVFARLYVQACMILIKANTIVFLMIQGILYDCEQLNVLIHALWLLWQSAKLNLYKYMGTAPSFNWKLPLKNPKHPPAYGPTASNSCISWLIMNKVCIVWVSYVRAWTLIDCFISKITWVIKWLEIIYHIGALLKPLSLLHLEQHIRAST